MCFLEKVNFEGHKIIDKIGLKHLSSNNTFSDFAFKHLERSYPFFRFSRSDTSHVSSSQTRPKTGRKPNLERLTMTTRKDVNDNTSRVSRCEKNLSMSKINLNRT